MPRFSPSVFGVGHVLDNQFPIRSAGGSFAPQPGFVVSGTFAQDSLITVDRGAGGFGTKNGNGPPLYLWEFGLDGVQTLSPLARGTPPADFVIRGSIQSGVTDTGYSEALEFDPVDTPNNRYSTWGQDTGAGRVSMGDPQKMLRDRRLRWNRTGADMYAIVGNAYNCKYSRYGETDQNNCFSARAQTDTPHGDPRLSVERVDGATTSQYTGAAGVDIDHFGLTYKNTWRTIRDMQDKGTLNVADGELWLVVDGYKWRWVTMMRDTPYNQPYDELSGDNGWVNCGFRWHYEYDYVDDSWCSVYLTDSATFDPGGVTEQVIQIPTVWADNQVRFRTRWGHLPTASPAHVHIQLDDGSTLYAGVYTP